MSNVSNKKNKWIFGVIGGLITAFAGAYFHYFFALKLASSSVSKQSQSIVILADKAKTISEQTEATPELQEYLNKISQYAVSIEANMKRVRFRSSEVDQLADLWLTPGEGVVLGESLSFGFHGNLGYKGGIWVKADGRGRTLNAGERLDYKTKRGDSCFISYVGNDKSTNYYGFNLICQTNSE